jgi:hypothetical protein
MDKKLEMRTMLLMNEKAEARFLTQNQQKSPKEKSDTK